jgi:molybdopterin synthase catalytic subunit
VIAVPIRVLYFAAAREAAGTSAEELAAAGFESVAALRRALAAGHPELAAILPRCRIAVGEELAGEDTPVPDRAEVAVVPPVAGGAPLFAVVARPLSLDEVIAAVRGPGTGAIATFTGTVRGATAGRKVIRLEYEVYLPMAERVLARIGAEVGATHDAALAVVHRVGVLVPGDAAVVIAAAAARRAPAFRACEDCLERLKREVPIWKREVFEDGAVWVGMGA